MTWMGRHGDGGVTKRRDGRLQVSITLTTGRRIYRTIPRLTDAKRQRELAERVRRELIALREAEIDPGGQTIAVFLRSWLSSMADAANPRIRLNTLAFYTTIAEKHVIPALGDIRLESLHERHVQTWLDGLRMSPQYVSHCRAFLRRVLNVAVRQRVMMRNPATNVEVPPIPRYRAKAMTAVEARALLAATKGDRDAALWRLAVVTGLRAGELLALAWDDIDLEVGTVGVKARLARQNGGWVRAETKTTRDLEDVSIDADTIAILEAHRVRQAAERRPDWPYWGLVFTTPNGYPVDRHNLMAAFRDACDRAGIARRRVHDIRHSNVLGVSRTRTPEPSPRSPSGEAMTTPQEAARAALARVLPSIDLRYSDGSGFGPGLDGAMFEDHEADHWADAILAALQADPAAARAVVALLGGEGAAGLELPQARLDLDTLLYVRESIAGIEHVGGTVNALALIDSIIGVRAEVRGEGGET